PQAARGRARARHAAEAAAPRRGDGGPAADRMRPDGRGFPRPEPDLRHHDPAHRARHARGHGARAARRRPAPRGGHRARRAAGDRAQPGGARVLPGRGNGDMSSFLEITELDLYYGDAQALAGVTLDVPQGAIVAIIGANGAGKTSLIRTIAGIERSH